MINKRIIYWVVIIGVAVAIIMFGSLDRGPKSSEKPNLTPTLTPTTSSSPSQSPGSSPRNTPKSTPSGSAMGPATCQLNGSINFINDNLYETKGAKITYQNIDSPARLVYWNTIPNDGVLLIGPNIFSGLVLPNGEREVGVSLEGEPTARSYTLTASVTYGETDTKGVERIKTSTCTGTVTVTIPNP